VSVVFVGVAFFAFYVKMRARESRTDGLFFVYPMLGFSVAIVVLLSLSTMQRDGCNYGSGYFIKAVDVIVYAAILFQIAQTSVDPKRVKDKRSDIVFSGDLDRSITQKRPVVTAAKLEAEAQEFDPNELIGQLSFS